MSFLIYMALGFIAFMFQTTIFPHIGLFSRFYDLILIFVVCLGLFHSIKESILIIFIMGYVMDNTSGSPFGLYMTTYFWTYAGIVWTRRFLDVNSIFLLPIVIGSAVAIENLIFLISMLAKWADTQFPHSILLTVIIQIIWALTTGPFLILSIQKIYNRCERWYEDYRLKGDGYDQA